MRDYRALIERDSMSFVQNFVRLQVLTPEGALLMPDGKWFTAEEGTRVESGLLLPAGSIEAVAQAISDFQGHTSHADTEARVLREWLAVERGRVDKALDR